MRLVLTATLLLLTLSACSSEPADPPPATRGAANESAPAEPSPSPAPSPPAEPVAPVGAKLLTLEGLGALRIGQAVPAGSGWAERGAQISESCRTFSSPAHAGVYAIAEDGKVRRITVGQGSDVKLAEGLGVGAAEAEARSAFPGFRDAPHKYSDPPAKYLTAPNTASGDAALRFEIGPDGRVVLIHVGTMPVLGYVEGCA